MPNSVGLHWIPTDSFQFPQVLPVNCAAVHTKMHTRNSIKPQTIDLVLSIYKWWFARAFGPKGFAEHLTDNQPQSHFNNLARLKCTFIWVFLFCCFVFIELIILLLCFYHGRKIQCNIDLVEDTQPHSPEYTTRQWLLFQRQQQQQHSRCILPTTKTN